MRPLVVSFSGGKTSAYMTYLLLRQHKNLRPLTVIFANTGQEHEATLDFVHRCDMELQFRTVWVEAAVSQAKGEGTTFTQVTYETASRHGEPYEAVI